MVEALGMQHAGLAHLQMNPCSIAAAATAETLSMGAWCCVNSMPLLLPLVCSRSARSGESVMTFGLSGGASGSGSGAWSHAMDTGQPKSPSSHVTGWCMRS